MFCVGWDFFGGFSRFFFLEHTRPAARMRPSCLIYLFTSNMVFVHQIYDMVVDTQFHKFYGRPFARVLYLFLAHERYRSVTPLGATSQGQQDDLTKI